MRRRCPIERIQDTLPIPPTSPPAATQQEHLPDGKVDDFGITFDIDLDLGLLCAGMADKLGLCKILVGGSRKQLQQWSMASVPILGYPHLEMVGAGGCAVKIEQRQPSIGIELVSHKWVLDSPLVQISGGHAEQVSLHFGEEIPARLGELIHVASLRLFGTLTISIKSAGRASGTWRSIASQIQTKSKKPSRPGFHLAALVRPVVSQKPWPWRGLSTVVPLFAR